MPKQFGILAPVMGIAENIPSVLLGEPWHKDNENVLVRHGGVERIRKPEKELVDASLDLVPTPDGNPIMHYHFLEKPEAKYLLAFTKANIYHWDSANKEWDRKHVCASDVSYWSTVTFNNMVIATNYVDKVLYWDGSMDTFRNLSESTKYSTGTVAINNGSKTLEGTDVDDWSDDLESGDVIYISGQDRAYTVDTVDDADTITLVEQFEGANISGKTYIAISNNGINYAAGKYLTKAKFVWNFENRIVLGYTEKNSETCASDIDWCAQSDHTEWLGGDSGSATVEGDDFLTGGGIFGDYLILMKSETIHRLWLVASSLVFNASMMKRNMGCDAPGSIERR